MIHHLIKKLAKIYRFTLRKNLAVFFLRRPQRGHTVRG